MITRALRAAAILLCWLALAGMFVLLFLAAAAQGETRRMVTMYDAGFGNAHLIPANAQAVAGHGFTQALWDLWPHAAHVTIAHSPTDYGEDVVDFEPGGGWVWGIPNLRTWLKGHQAAGLGPGVVYVNKSRIWMVNLAAKGLVAPWIWASDQTGQAHMVSAPNVIATQWYGSTAARKLGRSWDGVDISEVSDIRALTGGRWLTNPGPPPVTGPGGESGGPTRSGRPWPQHASGSAASRGAPVRLALPAGGTGAQSPVPAASSSGGVSWVPLLLGGAAVALLGWAAWQRWGHEHA